MDDKKNNAENKAKVKVSFVMFHNDPKTYTGGPRVLANLLALIDTSKIEPIIISNNEQSRMTKDIIALGFNPYIIPMGQIMSQGKLFDKGILNKLKGALECLIFNFKVFKILRKEKVQVVWLRNVKILLFVGFSSKLLRIPVIWDIGMEKFSKGKGIMYYIHYTGFTIANKVIAEAKVVFDQVFNPNLLKRFQHKTGAIKSAIGQERINAINKAMQNKEDKVYEKGITLLFVGTLIDRKNPMFLLKGIKKIKDDGYNNFTLNLVGAESVEPAYVDQLKNYVADLGIAAQVNFLGWREDIPDLMVNHDALVITSKNEGVPYTIIEAMYARMPILGANVGGIPEVIDHEYNGLIYQNGNLEDFKKKFLKIVNEENLRENLSQNAFEYVAKNHVPEKWVKAQEELFFSLIERRN